MFYFFDEKIRKLKNFIFCLDFYPPCEDLDSNCAVFVNGSCSNVLYRAYMREHCRRHCNECYCESVEWLS